MREFAGYVRDFAARTGCNAQKISRCARKRNANASRIMHGGFGLSAKRGAMGNSALAPPHLLLNPYCDLIFGRPRRHVSSHVSRTLRECPIPGAKLLEAKAHGGHHEITVRNRIDTCRHRVGAGLRMRRCPRSQPRATSLLHQHLRHRAGAAETHPAGVFSGTSPSSRRFSTSGRISATSACQPVKRVPTSEARANQ